MANDIWSVADLLRGDYMRHEYGEIILPLTVLRRLDAVMAKTRQAVWDRDAVLTSQGIENKDRLLKGREAALLQHVQVRLFAHRQRHRQQFVAKNLRDYISYFSEDVRKIIERFDLDNQITRMAEGNSCNVVGRFAACTGSTRCPRTTWVMSSST